MAASVVSEPHSRPLSRALFMQIILFGVYYAISQARGQRVTSNNQINQRTLTANQHMAMALLTSGKSDSELMPYKCAQHCTCSMVPTHDSLKGTLVNLTRASCKSPLFSDVLTIDRRTQIIHISLPPEPELSGAQQPTGSRDQAPDATEQPLSKQLANGKRKQQIELMTKLLNINVTEAQKQQNGPSESKATGGGGERKQQQQQPQQFRMPRLMQFTMLREIVIVNLRLEVCDSEIFKRNQRLHTLKWNFNQLKQVSKSCFRHLDKLLELNLDHNHLDELESALFSPLVSLRHLSLAHNRLSELTAHQFANLTHLQSLNLVGNAFRVMNLNLFEPMAGTLQLLVLARNQIRQFVVLAPANATSSSGAPAPQAAPVSPLAGVMFRNLIKLNVDFNKFERVKLLQLHRFFNVKFLSMRGNNIASIRDKAFNGLRLVELNLAQNGLASISRCAFCNATIKRLNLAENNISSPNALQLAAATGGGGPPPLFPVAAAAAAAASDSTSPIASAQQLVAASGAGPEVTQQPFMLNPPASSASMLVLSQSILGPLFGHLEYLDLSENRQLAGQLEFLLEPLLELQYLNLAATGLDRVLPTPTLFKNLRRLRYLNLSMNHLDQVVAETVEPLVELELLDLSRNDFSELDESFLVVMDELPVLKFVNLASNPWYCSQCKISALYDWIARSPIYNATCLAQAQQQQAAATSLPVDDPPEGAPADPHDEDTPLAGQEAGARPDEDTSLGFIYHQQAAQQTNEGPLARGPHDYSVLGGNNQPTSVDFDLILDLFEGDAGSAAAALLGALEETLAGATPPPSSPAQVPNYQLVAQPPDGDAASHALVSQFRDKKRQLSERLLRSLASPEDDRSIGRTIASLLVGAQLAGGQLAPEASELLLKSYFGPADFCLKCEFPSELRSFNLHELAPADFKYCAGSAPRFAASEPKIGLTLAIVIIGALFIVIIVVIVMYRKKSNAYYPGEDLAEQLEAGQQQQQQQTGGMKKPVLSISSDVDHQYGDNTDYSSPPMSQSYSGEESYTERSGSQDRDDEDDDPDDDEDLDEDEYEDEDEEDEDEEGHEDEEEGGSEEDEDFDGDDEQPGGGAGERDGGSGPAPQHPDDYHRDSGGHQNATHPKARFEEEQTQTETAGSSSGFAHQQQQAKSTPRQPSRELSTSASRSRSTTSGGGGGGLVTPSPHAPSPVSSPRVAPAASSSSSGGSLGRKQASLNRSHSGQQRNGGRSGRQAGPQVATKQMTHNDRDDSTTIYIGPRSRDSAGAGNVPSPNSSFDRAVVASDATTPASLSAGDLLASANLTTPTADLGHGSGTPEANGQHYKGESHKLVQLASLAGSLHESHSRAMARAQRARENNANANSSAKANANEENSQNFASSLSRSESRLPEPAQTIAPATTPKTILHHHIQHRHSSESHVANVGPVSFAPTASANHRPQPGDGPRRDRLQRATQTICVDHQLTSEFGRAPNHQVKSAGGAGPNNVRDSSGGAPTRPRHQMTTLATISGLERPRPRQPGEPRAGRSIFVAQAPDGRTLVDFTQAPAAALAHPRTRPPPPPVMASTAIARHEDPLDLMEFARDSATLSTAGGAPTSTLPALCGANEYDDGNRYITSDKTAKATSRQVAALRGRPLVKQPHPHPPALSPKQEDQQVEQQIIRFDDDDEDENGANNQAERDSFDVEAQLADLPSDLDETDLDQMLADEPPSSLTDGGGALEFDREDDQFSGERIPVMPGHDSNNMRNSRSTHSALTQT